MALINFLHSQKSYLKFQIILKLNLGKLLSYHYVTGICQKTECQKDEWKKIQYSGPKCRIIHMLVI